MTDYQRLVREWHEAKGVAVADSLEFPSEDLAALRGSLILEEAAEAVEALDALGCGLTDSLSDIAKELADLLYVVFGAAVSLGIDLGPVFEEVHKSNMTKDAANKRADGKILKGPRYVPPDVVSVLMRQDRGSR